MTADQFLRKPKVQRRVVVTGLGGVTPLGLNATQSWQNAINGNSGIGPITQFDATGIASQIAGEVKDFDPSSVIEKKDIKKMDRFIQMTLVATKEAMDDSGLEVTPENAHRIGSFAGVGMGGLPLIGQQQNILMERGARRVSPFFIPAVITNLASGHISINYKIKGPNFAVTSACASGVHALGESYRYIRDGVCDAMISGGSESVLCGLAVGGFASMKALSTRNDQPELASRPFDSDRDGFVIAEGTSMFILESYESAHRRGAKIYGEITGYGASSDGYHMTNPEPAGDGAFRAMQTALEDAELNPEDMDYINAHGTSTPAGDRVELQAIQRLLETVKEEEIAWVSSTKSMTGHALGAAGAIESLFCLKALESGSVPPTINLDTPLEELNDKVDLVPHTARDRKLTHVMNNSFGFGGANSCLVFSKV